MRLIEPYSVPGLSLSAPLVRGDLLHDRVTVAVLIGDGEQDVKHRDRQRQRVVGTGR
jgi:hypothetical protein